VWTTHSITLGKKQRVEMLLKEGHQKPLLEMRTANCPLRRVKKYVSRRERFIRKARIMMEREVEILEDM